MTPNELNGGEAPFPDFHAVYIDPESFAHYEKTGEFRDGTVMIKELVGVGAKEATSGKGYFMGDFIGLEASIKDSKRFKDEPGNWAFFSFGHHYPLKAEAAKQNAAARATRATRPAPGRTTSSASTIPSCGRRPRNRSEADRSGPPGFSGPRPFPQLRRHIPWLPRSHAGSPRAAWPRWRSSRHDRDRRTSRPDDPPARAADDFSPYVTKDGGISRPTDYRDTFEFLGTYAVATKPGQPVDEMHVVYARPEDIRAYRRDGKFPDGATLVKEVTKVGSDRLTTGQANWATDIKLWFVMIKDAKGRFPGNDLWGDGWGWALFLAKEPASNVATDYTTDCKTCHIPARKDDWIYVRGYPALAKANPAK